MLVGFTRKENKPVPDIHFNNLSLLTPTREMPVVSVPYHDMPIQREYRGYVMGYTCVTKLPRVTEAIYTYVV